MFVPLGTQRALLRTIEDLTTVDPDMVLTYQDIADRAGWSRATVVRNLKPLIDRGILGRESAGLDRGGRGWGYKYWIVSNDI